MKQKIVINLILLMAVWTCSCSGRSAIDEERRSGISVMVFPVRLRTEIMTDERFSLDNWPGRKEKYDTAVRGAAGWLIRGLTNEGYHAVIAGNSPVIPKQQQGTGIGGALWPYIHASIMAGADLFLLCDITRMEFSEGIGHYGFEIYSVHTYRISASFDVRLIDSRTEKIIRSATVKETVTHRVHRLLWDVIWIHHSISGPELAEKLMESASGKVVRLIR